MYGSVNTKDKTILVCRLAMWLICTFLRIVWGGGKGEGYSSCRYAPVPNLIILSVRYDSVLSTLRISLALNSSCVPSRVKKALSCGQYTLKCSVHSDQVWGLCINYQFNNDYDVTVKFRYKLNKMKFDKIQIESQAIPFTRKQQNKLIFKEGVHKMRFDKKHISYNSTFWIQNLENYQEIYLGEFSTIYLNFE